MIINLNEFGGGGGSVSPEEIEKIVNENHYTKEESDAIVNDVKDIADEAKTIAESKADVAMVDAVKVIADEAKAVAEEAKTITESKADVAMVDAVKVIADEAKAVADEAKAVADDAKTIAEAKQDVLVSGTNIKTINGEDILGEGDIEIKGGSDSYTKEESDARYVQKESNKIWYKTTDGNTAQTTNATGITSLETMGLVSNEVVGDKCVMTFDKDVTSIDKYAFYNCTSLKSITIPNSVTSIGTFVFSNCTNLSNITIPNSVTSIGTNLFYGCSSLSSITIPDNVTFISNYAFENCSSLTSIEIPNSVKYIRNYAFAECSNLTSITIGNSVTSISQFAFVNCTSLSSITIGNSVTSIGSRAFSGVKTGGTLYCDETWFNNLSDTNKSNLYNVANWTKVWIPKPIEERVDVLEQTKTEKHLLTYDGTSIKDGETTIDYSTLHTMLMDTPDFVVLVYNNRAYHPNVVSDEQVVFISSYVSGGYLTSERLSISDENVVTLTSGKAEMEVNKTDSITDENKERTDKYPSLKAVSSYFENRIVILTQAEYDALETKGENTIYLIK